MMNQLLDMDYNLRYMTERYLTNKKREKKKQEISKRTSHPLSGLNHRPVYRSQPHQREKTSRKHYPGRHKKTSKKYCNTITWRLPFRHVESDRGQREGEKAEQQADAKIVKHDPEECGITKSKALFIIDGGQSWGKSWRFVTRKRTQNASGGGSLKT
jgi:hypothetical protein